MNGKIHTSNHNGWTNYETWAVNLWLANEEHSYRYWREEARQWSQQQDGDSVVGLAEHLSNEVQGAAPDLGATLYSDLLASALSAVDWFEIAQSMLDDATEEWQSGDDSCDGPPKAVANDEEQPDASTRSNEQDIEDDGHPFGPVIFAYSRAQALEDGVLVDVSEMSKEAGFRFPVALTRAVYVRYVVVPEGVEGQDEQGRLWDVLFMCSLALRGAGGSEVSFSLYVRNTNRGGTPPLVTLKAHCGPGDRGEPVITIMLPDED